MYVIFAGQVKISFTKFVGLFGGTEAIRNVRMNMESEFCFSRDIATKRQTSIPSKYYLLPGICAVVSQNMFKIRTPSPPQTPEHDVQWADGRIRTHQGFFEPFVMYSAHVSIALVLTGTA